MSFPIASSFPAKIIDLTAVPRAWTVEITEVVVLCDYLQTNPQKALTEVVVLCDTMYKDQGKTIIETVKVVEFTQIAGIVTMMDTAKVADYVAKDIPRAFTDTCKTLDLLEKTPQKTLKETAQLLEAFSKTSAFYRDFYETIKPLDYLLKDVFKSLIDTCKTTDLATREIAKILAETITASDLLTKTGTFHRDLYDTGKAVDVLAKDIPRTFRDTFIGEYYSVSSRGVIKLFTETLKGVDALTKTTLKALTDTGKTSDYIEKNVLKALLDSAKLTDWYTRSAIVTIIDRVFSEFTTSKDALKVCEDAGKSTDWVETVEHLVKELMDTVKPTDFIVKSPVKALIDSGAFTDWIYKTTEKILIFEFETVATGRVSRSVHYYRTLTDVVKALDWKGAFDILRNFKEFVIIRDQAVRSILVIITDTFLSEYWSARGIAPVVRDTAKMADILTKIAYKLYGYDVRRVYTFPREWADIIESLDHNTKVEVCKALLEAVKRLKDKLEG